MARLPPISLNRQGRLELQVDGRKCTVDVTKIHRGASMTETALWESSPDVALSLSRKQPLLNASSSVRQVILCLATSCSTQLLPLLRRGYHKPHFTAVPEIFLV